ncbi:MAG: outer membrane beta-barrel protein, partial [Bacteroidota bacterium]
MKQSIFTLFCMLVFVSSSLAKANGNIKGKVQDADSNPLAYANVVLYNAVDSSVLKLELSDEDGKYQFSQLEANSYYIQVSFVGLPTQTTAIFELSEGGNYTVPMVKMIADANELETVTVTAQRPLLELKPDMMVMNVENSAVAVGDNALELLRKAPGVVIDNNENVSLLGKAGVQVYIDGKPSPLGGADLAAFLKTMQSSEIESIEIITNPSSKYDAQGNAGIINIKLKRAKGLGSNANLNLTYSQGEKMQYNGSINGNHRNKFLNVFGNYSHNYGENINFNEFYREQFGFVFDQRNDASGSWRGNNFRLGTDFFLGKQHTLGFLVNGFFSGGDWNSESSAIIGMIGNPQPDSILLARSESVNDRMNVNYNINYRFDNGNGKSLNIDADYGKFDIDRLEDQPNFYVSPNNEEEILSTSIVQTLTPTVIDIATFKVDYEQPLGEGKLGAGAKFSYVNTDNTFDFFNVLDGQNVLNKEVSNQFEYSENVNAAYANYNQKFGKLGVSAGLRMEQTNSEGDLTSFVDTENDNVKRNYLDFFPSGGLTYNLSESYFFHLN